MNKRSIFDGATAGRKEERNGVLNNKAACPLKLTLVLLRLLNPNGNVAVLVAVMEANLDQILLYAEAIHDRVLHGPSPFDPPLREDRIDFIIADIT